MCEDLLAKRSPDQLAEDIIGIIRHHCLENELSLAEVIGVLEIVKFDYCAGDYDEE